MSELAADHSVRPEAAPHATALSQTRRGYRGVITSVGRHVGEHAEEMERRLLEMGFVEGAEVEVLHEGPFGGDPMVVRLDDMRVALRRAEAELVLIGPNGGTP